MALVAIMATTGHWTFTSTMHRRFLDVFLVLALLVLVRDFIRARRQDRTPWESLRQALPPAATVIRDFVPFLIALAFYETLHDLTPLIRHDLADDALIAIDHRVLGVDAAVWMGRFGSPWLTRVMVLCYLSYFFTPAILASLMYWSGRRQLFRDFLVSLCVVTLLGYTGYLLVPAIGPYLYQAALFPDRLPGGGLKNTESVIMHIDALKGYARDCFPSLHTAHTTVIVAFAWRYSRLLCLVYLPIAIGLYISTIYLRMHYAVDVAAGFAAAAVAVAAGPRLERWWYRDAAPALARTIEE